MNPNFDPNQNPFESILAGLQKPGQGGGQGRQGGAAGGPPAMPGTPTLPPSQLEQGKNPSSTKPLVQAIGALQNYISSETDRDNILLARNVIKLLTQLVTKSEDSQLGNLQKGY